MKNWVAAKHLAESVIDADLDDHGDVEGISIKDGWANTDDLTDLLALAQVFATLAVASELGALRKALYPPTYVHPSLGEATIP